MKSNAFLACLVVSAVSSGFAMDKTGAMSGCPVNAPAGSSVPAGSGIKGKVTQTMNAARYTYVAVDDGTGEKWAAAPTFEVKVGDMVEISSGMPMEAFYSKTLNRTFAKILFAEQVVNLTKNPAACPATTHSAQGEMITSGQPAAGGLKIELPADGKRIAEVIADRAGLAGKTVTIRGQVVKFTPNIMKRNWLHLQDGSGGDMPADIAVTSDGVAVVGSVVTVKGVVSVNQDFGYGYRYDVLIEKAAITSESSK